MVLELLVQRLPPLVLVVLELPLQRLQLPVDLVVLERLQQLHQLPLYWGALEDFQPLPRLLSCLLQQRQRLLWALGATLLLQVLVLV